MFRLDLSIPRQLPVSGDYTGIKPEADAVLNWINQRDSSCSHDLLEYLQQLNRTQCGTLQRIEIMRLFNPLIESYLHDYTQQSKSVSFPLNDEQHQLIKVMQLLLMEMANSYKTIVLELTAGRLWLSAHLDQHLPEAIYFSLLYLSRLMVERYQVYISEPVFIWKEINQLYLLAEKFDCHKSGVQSDDSVEAKYLQITILHMLDPYRLMRFEARQIYQLTQQWADYCVLKPPGRNLPENAHIVDLLRDYAPFRSAEKPDITLLEGRFIDTTQLYEHLKKQLLRFLIKNSQSEGARKSGKVIQPVLTFSEHLYYEMLERIVLDLNFTGKRTEERRFSGNEIKMLAGFEACHHFINKQAVFDPQAELDLQKAGDKADRRFRDKSRTTRGMSFIDLLEEEKRQLNKNPFGGLNQLIFDQEADASDSYHSINTQQSFNEEKWLQRNQSDKGMLLICKANVDNPIAVGMLVAYRQPDSNVFNLAVVKWLRINPQKGMAIGVRRIASKSQAIAVKGEKGMGAGGQFVRAFIIREGVKTHTTPCLLVPAGVFNQGSILQVWYKKKLNRVKILRILMSTDAFEQIECQLIKPHAK